MPTFQEILQASVADQKRRQEQERFAPAWFFWRWPYRGRILTDGPRLFAPQEAGLWQARIELHHQGSRIYRYIWARGFWLLDLRTGQEILAASHLKSTAILPTVAQIQSGVRFAGTEAESIIGWDWWDSLWGPSTAEVVDRVDRAEAEMKRRDAEQAQRFAEILAIQRAEFERNAARMAAITATPNVSPTRNPSGTIHSANQECP
jgi:hypothetical protein